MTTYYNDVSTARKLTKLWLLSVGLLEAIPKDYNILQGRLECLKTETVMATFGAFLVAIKKDYNILTGRIDCSKTNKVLATTSRSSGSPSEGLCRLLENGQTGGMGYNGNCLRRELTKGMAMQWATNGTGCQCTI
jgi:hypothetical protein